MHRTLVTTAECLLHPNRRDVDGFSKQQVETELGRMLGIRKVIWLPLGLYADHHTNVSNWLASWARAFPLNPQP